MTVDLSKILEKKSFEEELQQKYNVKLPLAQIVSNIYKDSQPQTKSCEDCRALMPYRIADRPGIGFCAESAISVKNTKDVVNAGCGYNVYPSLAQNCQWYITPDTWYKLLDLYKAVMGSPYERSRSYKQFVEHNKKRFKHKKGLYSWPGGFSY